MVSPVKELSSAAHTAKEPAESTLQELRETVTTLAKEVAAVAERRTRGVREGAVDAAEAGTTELRRTIRRQPALSMGVAVAAGAVLALLVVPRFGRAHSTQTRWDRWAPSWTPNVTRADLHDLADTIQRSVGRAATAAAAPVTPAFERMVDALSRTDTSSMNTIIEKLGGWFQQAQDKAKETMR